MAEYFKDREEEAIKRYLSPDCPELEKKRLFQQIIYPAMDKLLDGLLQMPMFRTVWSITKQQLKEYGSEKMIEALHKFQPDRVGKNGQPVKAYSFLGTAGKNEMVIQNMKANRKSNINHDIDFEFSLKDKTVTETVNIDEMILFYKDSISKILNDPSLANKKKISNFDRQVGEELIYILDSWHELDIDSKKDFRYLLYERMPQLKRTSIDKSLKTFIINYEEE